MTDYAEYDRDPERYYATYEQDPERYLDQVDRCISAMRAMRNGDVAGAQIVLNGIYPAWVDGFMIEFILSYIGQLAGDDGLTVILDTHVARLRAHLEGKQP